MRLKKLELYGFKSFASRTEIVFEEGITGIVGPNGSGKSNIGDAIRWVLGEQSAKTLRGTNMADVIFNGTQKRKPLNYCEVSLVFDNSDHSMNLEYSEIMVTRRVYRNGESEYFLNQSSCRLKDVIDLFRDTGIGKEGYSIIGQGRIDEILSRKSEDRRLIFEEAAGIVKYKARKEEADRKLEKTLANEERIEDIIKELERQLGPLEEQSKSARKYLEWSEELKVLDLNLFIIRSDRLQERIDSTNTEIENVSLAIEQNDLAIEQKNDQLNQIQADIEKMDQEIDIRRKELSETVDHVHEVSQGMESIALRKSSRDENIQRIRREKEEAGARFQEAEKQIAASREKQARCEQEMQEEQKKLNEAQEKVEDYSADEARTSELLDAKKEEMLDAMNRKSLVQNDQTRLDTMISQMSERLVSMQEQLQQQNQEKEILSSIFSETVERRNEEQEELERIQKEQQDMQRQLASCNEDLSACYRQVDEISGKLQAAKTRYHLLSEMKQEMDGYQQSVKRAMKYAREMSIPGVRGVLGQLISVPEKYETAIDMALGGAVQNIVTDNEETAKELIDYLRNNKLGRATFLPRSAVRGKYLNRDEQRVLSMPGCLGVASDLITCDGDYKAIVENLLGRTVIADNLDHGIAIMREGRHSFRLVTLHGDVMHSGGSMTGGSVQSKATSLLGREREINKLAADMKTLQADYDRVREQLETRQQEKNSFKNSLTEISDSVHQQEIKVAREKEKVAACQSDMDSNESRRQETESAIEQLNEAISDIREQLEEVNTKNSGGDFDQESMEEETADIQRRLVEIREKLASWQETVSREKLAINDMEHQIDILVRDIQRFEKEKEEILAENARRDQTLSELEATNASESGQLETMKKQSLEIEEKRQKQEKEIQDQESVRSGKQSEMKELIQDIEKLHRFQNEDQEKKHKFELQHTRYENELKNMQDRIWNTYELTYGGAKEFRVEDFKESKADSRAKELSSSIKQLGQVNVGAVEEYALTKARFDDLSAQQEDLKKAETDLKELIVQLMEQMKKTFEVNFVLIQKYFSETFVRLFGGGKAELLLTDPSDPLNCGIEINAQPPGKKLQLLSLLSGGERALTAIAILFAMLKLKPTPFCILDEIEAALDDANIGYYADYLKEYSENTQFIVITHRKGTMERCKVLYGVAMEEQGVSKMVSVSLQDYQE